MYKGMLYNIPVNFRDFHLIKYVMAFSLFTLLSFLIASSYSIAVYGQQQEQLDQQTAATNSPVNSICRLIQDNSLIAGLAGLDQATNICNNLNTIGSNQAALSELCSIVGGLNIINVESLCNQKDANQEQNQQPQSQALNKGNQLPENNQEGAESNIPSQSNTENQQQQQPSGSIIDRLLGMLFGFVNFGN